MKTYYSKDKTFRVTVERDYDGCNPREWSQQWKLHLKHPDIYVEEYDAPIDFDKDSEPIFENMDEIEMIVPVYAHIHGYVALSTSRFSCKLDSGLLGWAILLKKDATKNPKSCGWGATMQTCKEGDLKNLDAELKELQQYINGECYIVTTETPTVYKSDDGRKIIQWEFEDGEGGILADSEEEAFSFFYNINDFDEE